MVRCLALLSIVFLPIASATLADAAPKKSALAGTNQDLILLPAPCPDGQCNELPPPAALGLRVVYLNFDGVTLTASNNQDDAPTNRSAIVTKVVAPGQTITIAPFNPNELSSTQGLSRDQIISRVVNDLFASHAAYDVEFVTERPASGNYSMVVFGGSCTGTAGQNNCGGIALLDCGDLLPNNITFVFPPNLRVQDLGMVGAQEAAHAFGLAHTEDTTDIMFPSIQQSSPTSFGAGNVPPNEVSMGLTCGGANFQDSDALMLATIGERGQDTIPPAVSIDFPADGSVIGFDAMIAATVTDNVGVASVELLVSNASVGELTSGPFVFTLPAAATEGPATIEVRATDVSGNTASERIDVTISEGGGGSLGDECSEGLECSTGQCAELDGEQRCSQACDAQTPCPAGFECLGDVACWPEESGALCSATGSSPGDLAVLALGLLLIGVRRRRS